MTDLQRNTDHQCQCAQCRASRALDVLRALPSLPDDGRAALDTIEAALNELEEKGFARWDAMNDVATAAGLNWMDATQQDIVGAIEQTRARVTELEADSANWREALRMTNDALKAAHSDAALARAAELETALAAERDAHAWRPVTDDAPAPLEKVVVATRDDPDVAWRLPEVPHLWNTRRGRSLLTQEIAGYLPLPPQEPQ